MTLTIREVKQLCGRFSYERGQAYLQGGHVVLNRYDEARSQYEATVESNQSYEVSLELRELGGVPEINARCSCPSLKSYSNYCSHIAAVLLGIIELRKGEPARKILNPRNAGPSPAEAPDRHLDEEVLRLFLPKAPSVAAKSSSYGEERSRMTVEFICRPAVYGLQASDRLFTLELKLGTDKRTSVSNIRDFLEQYEQHRSYPVSKTIVYDPSEHAVGPIEDEIVRLLARIAANERTIQATAPVVTTRMKTGSGQERELPIPPVYWPTLQPLLSSAAHVQLLTQDGTYPGLIVETSPIPLRFEFRESEKGQYELRASGLDKLLVMEAYGVAISEGKLLKLPEADSRQLQELQRLMNAGGSGESIAISSERVGSFVEHAVPGLMKLGTVVVAPSLSEKLTRRPLRAKLYLDRVRDRLLAGLEFHYGDIVVNPVEARERRHPSDRILIREGAKEQAILEIMNGSGFLMTDSGYVMAEEETEYDFLYHRLPKLEKLAQVYATTAVKLRLHPSPAPISVKVDTSERTDWLEFRFELDGIRESELREIVKALQEKRKYYRLPEGTLLSLESPSFQDVMRLLDEAAIRTNEWHNSRARVPLARALLLSDALERDRNGAVRLGKSVRKLLENMRNPDLLEHEVPESLSPILRDYQKFGYQWMKTLARYHFGGVLADEMGLGKTLQSIAFLVSVLPEIRSSGTPALVVCPASLVYNWRNELRKFAPNAKAVIVDGPADQRLARMKDADGLAPDILITSYPLLRKDYRRYRARTFHTLILDEAQNFKNDATQTAKAVKSLSARHKFALTGTPIENNLTELWSIYDAVFPELFADRDRFFELLPVEVSKRVRPFLLRRLKSDVLRDLPDKIESERSSELLPEQKKLYVAYLAELRAEAVKHLKDRDHRRNRIRILAGLTRLRQLCCHPALFVEGYRGGSAKLEQLLELIEEGLASGRRILIFSQFTKMLDLIGKELTDRALPYFRLDGETPPAQRVELSERFNEGENSLFLVSLKAGGTGLNLTGADTVILYDLWWNPAVEAQATDRAHRIGQKKVVQVIRMVAEGTIEERMTELQQRKLHLIDQILEPSGEEPFSALTEDDLRELLQLE
ncbi:DEAD/DEAH box helicase [Cohnella thailandensis]|uniref:DEAD/DEAH box helicase n=1 Tax=Cohnella thailandensis TaxID=557557 RepID=A0A841T513_9BACL|nr:DEAD/DEAH box helicase [Cohnella thailandensis]MBB6636947.1 DEAD/DEAH box helicase [Cohnella thailandensis]MBP1973170.1 superfamily II DNA or RNA helicase [Cohnella thailandensis]